MNKKHIQIIQIREKIINKNTFKKVNKIIKNEKFISSGHIKGIQIKAIMIYNFVYDEYQWF